MASDSLALFRKGLGDDLGALAEEHYRHDLQPTDRSALQSASRNLSLHTTLGSVLGTTLGLYLAFRIRRTRLSMFSAFKASEKPTHVQFAGGRTEPIPDLTPLLRPSTLGDVATYLFFGAGGLFFGGETGLLTGSLSARRTIAKDPDSQRRIETAFRKFRAEVLRAQAAQLEQGGAGVPWRRV